MKLDSVTFEIGELSLSNESSHLQQFRNSGYKALVTHQKRTRKKCF
jgi:hypothetical protein